MNVEEINKNVKKLVDNIIGNLSFSMDYNSLVNDSKRLLLVEGQTDKRFIEKILNDDVACIIANKAFGTQSGYSNETINCKEAIMQVVYGMSKIPMLINLPKGSEKWAVFGMIDLDHDDQNGKYMSTPRLFITDTHDLETLLLSTDKELLQKLDGCVISAEDSKKALYLAYQLGLMRQVIYEANNLGLNLKPISGGREDEVDYINFVEDYRVNLKKLLNYINNKNDKALSSQKIKKLLEKSVKDKRVKKKLTDEYIWNTTWEEFDVSEVTDFWGLVNGHDILSILRFINQDAAIKYDNNPFSLNRKFEIDLVDNYEYKAFKGTQICKKMQEEGVVKHI